MPKRKGSSSNHPFSGAICEILVLGRVVDTQLTITLVPKKHPNLEKIVDPKMVHTILSKMVGPGSYLEETVQTLKLCKASRMYWKPCQFFWIQLPPGMERKKHPSIAIIFFFGGGDFFWGGFCCYKIHIILFVPKQKVLRMRRDWPGIWAMRRPTFSGKWWAGAAKNGGRWKMLFLFNYRPANWHMDTQNGGPWKR